MGYPDMPKDKYNQYIQEGLHIVDKRGLPFTTTEERDFEYWIQKDIKNYANLLEGCEYITQEEYRYEMEQYEKALRTIGPTVDLKQHLLNGLLNIAHQYA